VKKLYMRCSKYTPWFVHILPVSAVQKLLKSVKIWQSCSQMYTATFYEPRQKCKFWYFQVRCAHKSGDVINFIIFACRIFSRLKWYKNHKNRLRLAEVIVKNKMSRFLWFTVYFLSACVMALFLPANTLISLLANRNKIITQADRLHAL